MNPRYMYNMPYTAQQYQYRLPGPGPYCLQYLHPDLGVQYVYVQPYPQMPVIPCDPYNYGQSVPVMLRPPFPQPFLQPSLVRQPIHDNIRLPRPRASRSASQARRNGMVPPRNVRSGENEMASAKSGSTDPQSHPRYKVGTNEVSSTSSRHHQGPTKKATRKRRDRKSRKAKKLRGGHNGTNVNCEELSSINTDCTQARSKQETQWRLTGDDDEYETCEEEDLEVKAGNREDYDRFGTMPEKWDGPSRTRLQAGDTTVAGPPSSTQPECTRFIPLYSAKEDYWAAISGIESIWNPSDDSILCRSRGNECKCKRCSQQPAKLIVPPTPELWWDRSTGMELWPETCNDLKFGAKVEMHPAANSNRSASYILIDANQSCGAGLDHNAGDQAPAKANIDDNVPKRRLLSVDWNSISPSNVDGTMLRTNSNIESKIKSITEIDSAILERGPLTTESFSLPIFMQPSANRAVMTSAVPNSADPTIDRAPRGLDGGKELTGTGVQEYFQTAFTSHDICNSNAQGHITDSLQDRDIQTTCKSMLSVNEEAQRGNDEPTAAVKGVEAAASNESVSSLMCQAVAGSKMPTDAIDIVNDAINTDKKTDEPSTDCCAAAVESGPNKVGEDTDIPPDSIENGSVEGRRKLPVELRSNPHNDFQFPHSDQIFRERVGGDSDTPKCHDEECVTVNKKIYEDSKPTPCTTDDVPSTTKTIRTVPSSPVTSKSKILRRSLSLNDLRRVSEADRKNTKTHKLDTKPPPVPASDRGISDKAVKGKSNVGNDRDVRNRENVAKIEKPKRAWKQNAKRTKYPTGIPLNSMLNDTIRRNFRQKASPVAIFEIYRPPADLPHTNPAALRPPSIDDWSEVMVRPVPVGAYCMQKALASSDHGLQLARYDQALNSHYIPLPVVMYPPANTSKPKVPENVGRPRPRRQVLKRRNSVTAVQLGSATQVRKTRFQQHGGTKITAAKVSDPTVGNDDFKNSMCRHTIPAAKPKPGVNRLKISGEKLDKTYPQANDGTSSTTASYLKQTDECNQQTVSSDNKGGESGQGQHEIHISGKRKESFLKRIIRRKKWNKQSASNETKVPMHDSIADSQYHPQRKSSKQGKIRANIASKKNRLLGRSSKSRLQGLSFFATEDHNGNSSRPPFDEMISRELPRSTSDGVLRPREPAIETPAQAEADRTNLKAPDHAISDKHHHPRLLDADSSLPGPINQGREDKSVAGTPGVRINSETGDIIETSDAKLMSTFLCSTKIVENENANCDN